ncbi:MAG: SbmA/BacA-like family transporter [Hyphomicrobiales bacterium]
MVQNWYGIMSRTKRLTFLTAGYNQVAIIFPFLVVSPVYFFGTLTLGGLMQIAQAFSQVQSALSFFVTAYSSIADWKAVLDRLAGFEESIGWAQSLMRRAAGRVHQRRRRNASCRAARGGGCPGEIVHLSDLVICAGRPHPRHRTVWLRQDEPVPRTWGVWPFGTGAVRLEGASVLVLPQRPYLPLGHRAAPLPIPVRRMRSARKRSTPCWMM